MSPRRFVTLFADYFDVFRRYHYAAYADTCCCHVAAMLLMPLPLRLPRAIIRYAMLFR